MIWETSRLGNIITLQRGHDLPSHKRCDGDVPVVSSSGITGHHNEYKANPPGVVTGRYGTLGEVFYITQDYWPLNTALYVTDFKGNIPRFIAYFLKYVLKDYRSDKAAVPGVDRNVLHELEVRVPDRGVQTTIARILSTYDELIENNQRRLNLLEESARLLYREWFVYFRFPGHEHVKIKCGIPTGWSKKTLGELAPLNYGKSLKAEERVNGLYPVFGSSGIVGTHEVALVKGPAIIVGRKGNVGSIYWSDSDFHPIDTVYFIDSANSTRYLYYALKHIQFISTDVAVPGLNRDFAHSKEILMPPSSLLKIFEESIAPMLAQISNLTQSNAKLSQARDILLPKLMNGKVSI